MDTKIWKLICRAIRSADRRIARTGRRPKFTDQQIVKMYLWAVGHDRPLCWACDRKHYTTVYRPRQLPSVSQFCRRIKMQRTQQLLEEITKFFLRQQKTAGVAFIDGKPLMVRGHTKDPDAKKGYGENRMGRGYKLHAVVTQDGWFKGFAIHSLNVSEPRTAHSLLDAIPPGMLILADGSYDSGPLYQFVHDRRSFLLTKLRCPKGSDEKHLFKRICPARRAAIFLWEDYPDLCEKTLKTRIEIERVFAALTSFGGGLSPLPAWVRRLPRVRRWVTAKIVIYHARLFLRKAA